MSTNPGEAQVEGGNDAANFNTPENDELIVAPSAPFNPEAKAPAQNIVPQNESVQESNANTIPQEKYLFKGWWWKILIILLVLFVMILFIIWIGPTYIWGDNAKSNGNNAAQGTETFSPTYMPTFYPTLEPTLSPVTTLPTFSPSIPTRDPTTTSLRPTMKPTLCPVDQGTYVESNEVCEIIDSEMDGCMDVDNGHKYKYEMDPQGCSSSGITCTEMSYCFNNTHYYDGAMVYEMVYTWHTVGDIVTCTVTRSCEDGACETCSNADIYEMNILIIISMIFTMGMVL